MVRLGLLLICLGLVSCGQSIEKKRVLNDATTAVDSLQLAYHLLNQIQDTNRSYELRQQSADSLNLIFNSSFILKGNNFEISHAVETEKVAFKKRFDK